MACQFLGLSHTGAALEVQRNAKLVRIEIKKRSTFLWMMDITRKWPKGASRIACVRTFNLYDPRAKIGQKFRTEGSSNVVGEIENGEVTQCPVLCWYLL